MAKFLIVEDDPDILEVIKLSLEMEMPDSEIYTASDGEAGLQQARRYVPDMILLDVMMPKKDGIEVCRELRADKSLCEVPVIMLSAKSEESDVVLGLGLGADDYIAKPVRPKELIARIKNLLRRSGPVDSFFSQSISAGPFVIDPVRFEVRTIDEVFELTPTQFRVLYTLAKSPGRVFRRDELIDAAVGTGVVLIERNVDTHVKSVRKKLGIYADLIKTVRGVGYKFID